MRGYEFCTLFDTAYLPRALVLYRSLERWCPEFLLRAYCMDEQVEELLRRLSLPKLRIVGLAELEAHDPGLGATKPTRSHGEYCWTATPAICLHALEMEPDLAEVTYVDADLMFFHDPAPIFAELGDDSVLITPHRYAPDSTERRFGIYNVQFMTFRNDERGVRALRWWHERCLEWCYARLEDGRFGDQKYLDDWPERFDGVHVLAHPGAGLAPWNVRNHVVAGTEGATTVDGRPLIFFHYHGLHLYSGIDAARRVGLFRNAYAYTPGPQPLVWRTHRPLRRTDRELIWAPYMRELSKAVAEVRRLRSGLDFGFERVPLRQLTGAVRHRLVPDSLRQGIRRADAGLSRRHRDSWKSESVVRQMQELAAIEREAPEQVAPFRVFRQAIDSVLAETDLDQPARFLDVGCGIGQYAGLLKRWYPSRFVYTGCDYAEPMIAAARREHPDLEFLVNDILDNRIDLDGYDIVLASALIDVLADYRSALDVLLASGAPVLILHRQRVTAKASHAIAEPGYEGQTTYASFLNEAELRELAGRHGRRISRRFDVEKEIATFVLTRRDAT